MVTTEGRQQRTSSAASECKMDIEAVYGEEKNAEIESGVRRNRQSSSALFPPDRLNSCIQELAFLDIKYQVETMRPGKQAETLTVLGGVSGQANSGEMLALMGPSGSGKTSLLNVLAQRVPHKSVTGNVFVDGSPLSKSFKRRMGFVFQDDMCLWNLTVRETVMFAAKLRLPQKTPEREKEDRVTELIDLLGLTDVADGVIGKEGRRGISGGERKRVSIGVELITSPDVIFLDEPTSGLDASTALTIINILRKLTKEGMIVMCSIHQPRSNIFSAFDKVMLLKKGRMAYYGPRSSVVKYFEKIGLNLPAETNSADWILDLTTSSPKVAEGKSLEDAYLHFMTQPARKELDMTIPTELTISKTRDRLKGSGSDKSVWMTSFWYQLRVLLQRQSKQSRGEVLNFVTLTQIMFTAIVVSAVWWQSENIADISGVLFFISIQQTFNAVFTSMRIFPPERSLMMRERSTGSYRVGPYFLAKSTSDMGLYTVAPLLYATFVYWATGLRPEAGVFFIFMLIFTFEILVGQSLGILITTAISDVFVAQSISSILILLLMLLGGFYVNTDNIAEGIWWIRYLSFFYYGYGALLHNELHDREFRCDSATGRALTGLPACAEGGSGVVTGDEILDEYGFPDVNIWENLAVLAGMVLGFRLLAYTIIRHSAKLRT